MDQSAIRAERIIGENQLLSSHKLKNLFEQKNQTSGGINGDKLSNRKNSKLDASKDLAVRKAFSSLLFSGDDNDEMEPDQEENSSDESFDGERSRLRNFNLFLSENDRPTVIDEKEKTNEPQTNNPKVMFIERLGMHFGFQPKIGLSESLVIGKSIGDENGSIDQTTPSKSESEIDLLFNGRSTSATSRSVNSNKIKESRNEDPTPFILRYAAAAMVGFYYFVFLF